MASGATFQDFFTRTMGEFGSVPKRGLIYAATAGALSAAADLAHWSLGPTPTDIDYAAFAFVICVWLVAGYATTMAMIDKPFSSGGFFRFTGMTIATFVPIFSGLAMLVYASRENANVLLTFALAVLIFGVLVIAFLPAWPIAQGLSRVFVNPARVVKATRGYRWSLVLVFFAASSVNKLVPNMSSASNVGEAALLAIAGAVVSAATLVLTASIAVTAWKFATQRDPSLAFG